MAPPVTTPPPSSPQSTRSPGPAEWSSFRRVSTDTRGSPDAPACLVSRPIIEIIELSHTGIETHGITSVLAPWYDGSTDVAHVSVQPNTVGGGSSGTGVLLLGYGSSGWNMKYGSQAERNRSLILPERLDFDPGEDSSSPRGVTFGQVVIDRDGVIHAREFRKLPD